MLDNQARLPIVVGVTGHRDIPLECHAALERRVADMLRQVQALYPASPVELLSPLADGGDRIGARAALSLGIRLIAPLPMAEAAYRQDFDAASQVEFDHLTEKAAEVFVVAQSPKTIAPGERGAYYRRVGQFIADHAHLLIALWDGRETLFPEGGGTYETVLLSRQNNLPVYVIPTPRKGETYTDAALEVLPDARLTITDQFNCDAQAHIAYLSDAMRASAPYVFGDLPASGLSASTRWLADACLCADALSVRWRDERLRVLRLLSALGLVMVLLFLLYDEMESNLMLLGYAGVLTAAFFTWLRSRRREPHEKYVRYRVIAEMLRVQFYWRILGIGQSVFSGLHFIQKAELPFLEFMMRSMRVSVSPEVTGATKACVSECFIKGQLKYHLKSERKKLRQERANGTAVKWMTTLSLALLALVAVMELSYAHLLEHAIALNAIGRLLLLHGGQAVTWRSVLKILLGTATAGTAFLANYYGSLALPPQISDNQRMQTLYEHAGRQVTENPDALIETIVTLGREAANECANWYISQKDGAPKLFM